METYAYDIECLKNVFTATFVNVENKEDFHVFVIGLGRDDRESMVKFLRRELTLAGYNSDSYDGPMLRFILSYKGTSINTDLYKLSSKLVDDAYRNDKAIIELRYPKGYVKPWKSVDLMRILAFDKLGISLKQTAINLGWHKIQDMPIDHTATAKVTDLDMILSYNMNDVLITDCLYHRITPLRQLREELSKLYNVDLSSASDSRMANIILENIYANELGVDIKTVRELRTPREKVLLGACMASFVRFHSPELKELHDRISSTYVYRHTNFKYSESIYFAGCNFSLGVGGLHTVDDPATFVSDDEYLIQDMDVASYYPNLIINNNFYPEHLGKNFITVLKKITEERLAAKHSGDKVKADGLKITINSIFGKMGSETFWLLDPKQMLSTTLSGQMGLLMLVEALNANGIHVISCNTDGIVCKIPRKLLDTYYSIAKAWEKETNLELEFTPYKKYVRRDVNSYITEKEDGKTKEKGAFLKEVDLKKAYHMPIVAKTLHAYFIKGVPVRDFLEQCTDIMEFCISQKSGNNFVIEYHTADGITELQKTNRFFVSKKGGRIIKRDRTTGKKTGLYVGNNVTILNDFNSETPFKDYAVDLNFYEKEVMKIVDEIEPKQMTLFDMTTIERSSMKKMEIPACAEKEEENKNEVSALNKLGKNQLSKRLSEIAESYQTIDGISPRYVYIMGFNSRKMLADMYCLAKCVRQEIYVDKDAFANARIEPGQLVFCEKFSKTKDGEHCVTEYRITDKIESDITRLF